MGWWEELLGYPTEIMPGGQGFGWSCAGMATKYLLVTCHCERPQAALFGTHQDERAALMSQLQTLISSGAQCLLLGVETHEVASKFFQLDPHEAIERLRP